MLFFSVCVDNVNNIKLYIKGVKYKLNKEDYYL